MHAVLIISKPIIVTLLFSKHSFTKPSQHGMGLLKAWTQVFQGEQMCSFLE